MATSSELTLILLKRKVEELTGKLNTMATKESLGGLEETLRKLIDSRYFTLRDKIDCHISAGKDSCRESKSRRGEEARSGESQRMKLWVQRMIEQCQKSVLEKVASEGMKESVETVKKKCERLAHENAVVANSIKEIEANGKRQMAEVNENIGKKLSSLMESYKSELNILKKKLTDKSFPNKDNKKLDERLSSIENNYKTCLNTQAAIQAQLRETNEATLNLKEVIMNKLLQFSSQLEACKQNELASAPQLRKTEEIVKSADKPKKNRNNSCQLVISSKKGLRAPRSNRDGIPLLEFDREVGSNDQSIGKSDDDSLKLSKKLLSQSYGSDVFCEPSEHELTNTEEDKELFQFIHESIKGNVKAEGVAAKSRSAADFMRSTIARQPKELKAVSYTHLTLPTICSV
eukprot:TRINITY_DN1544_c0_g1_i3.p1 TRINITY_DN1544_c0_g1~~TRINITY_DN1544_c0_g1_i3.p1  ORF type:complete len:404 (+),score=122.65 TRINITY_DN1544_c0_g1_i3:262-1473(+)